MDAVRRPARTAPVSHGAGRGFCLLAAVLVCVPTLAPEAVPHRTRRRSVASVRSGLREAESRYGAKSPEATTAALQLSRALEEGPDGNIPEAEHLARRAVAARQTLEGRDSLLLADALDNLAQVMWRSGALEEERGVVERALAIREREAPADARSIARDLHYLSVLRLAEGDYSGAKSLRDRIGPMVEREFGPESPEMATHLKSLAQIDEATGDLGAAIHAAARAQAIQEAIAGPTDPVVASALNYLGHLLLAAGDLDRAEPRLRRALAIWESSPGLHPGDVARALSNLGMLALERHDFAAARPFLVRALEVRSRVYGPDHVLVARSLSALGALERRLGDRRSARDHLRQAVAIEEKTPLAIVELADSLLEEALLDWEEGDAAVALEKALRVETITRERFQKTSDALSEREALAEARMRHGGLGLAITAATALMQNGTLADGQARQVFDATIHSRALILDAVVERRRAVSLHEDAATRELEENLRRARHRLDYFLAEATAAPGAEARPPKLQEAVRSADRAERALADRSREFRRTIGRRRVGLEEVLAALPPGAALVSYVRYDSPDGGPESGEGLRYAAFVARADRPAPIVVPIGTARDVDAAVDAWAREVAQDPRVTEGAGAYASYDGAARRLAAAIWDPVAARIEGAGCVFVTLDGALNRVNLATLETPGGDYLIEAGPAFQYLTAERDLVPSGDTVTTADGLLVVGDPALERADPIQTAAGDGVLGPLPGARGEARDVAARARPGERTLVLLGERADEANFKRLAPTFEVLHLATHAVYREIPSSGPLADDPLQLAAVALSSGGTDSDDGLLSAEEIASLDLEGVKWAVLSACATGRGRSVPSEGVLGLRRAFQIAGVRTLIVSLWPVEDEATRGFMRRLYDARREGENSTAAVREASRELLSEERHVLGASHPYFWGGFVAVGDWR
jgi:CHAT domain-containing protein